MFFIFVSKNKQKTVKYFSIILTNILNKRFYLCKRNNFMLIPILKNTDEQRYVILKNCSELLFADYETASEFGEELSLQTAKYLDIFDRIRAYDKYLEEEKKQQDANFVNLFDKAALFLRHYLLTMHMAIERGEMPVTTAEYYGLKFPFEIPEFKSDVQLIKFAEKLFEDDLKRTSAGGKYFTNPSIGAVKVWVEKFAEAVEQKNNKYNIKRGEVENIDKIRSDTDILLKELFGALLNKIGPEPDIDSIKILSACGFEFTDGDKLSDAEIITNHQTTEKQNVKINNDKPGQLRFDL